MHGRDLSLRPSVGDGHVLLTALDAPRRRVRLLARLHRRVHVRAERRQRLEPPEPLYHPDLTFVDHDLALGWVEHFRWKKLHQLGSDCDYYVVGVIFSCVTVECLNLFLIDLTFTALHLNYKRARNTLFQPQNFSNCNKSASLAYDVVGDTMNCFTLKDVEVNLALVLVLAYFLKSK